MKHIKENIQKNQDIIKRYEYPETWYIYMEYGHRGDH